LVVDSGKIYWSDPGHGTIMSRATTGGPSSVLAMNEAAPTLLVVRSGTVYWIDTGNNTIRAVVSGGGSPKTLVAMAPGLPDGGLLFANDAGIHGIALSPDGETLYFSAGADVYKMPAAGGEVVELGYSEGPRHGAPAALAVDTRYVYYPTAVNGTVEMMSLTTPCDLAAATGPAPSCPIRMGKIISGILDVIVARGDHVYWGTSQSVRMASISAREDGGISVNAGSDYPPTVDTGQVTGFAIGDAYGYFGEFPVYGGKPEDGFIEKAPSPPYPPTSMANALVIARNQPMPTSFALDGTNVYWTTSRCDIMTLADSPQ
jgi:hypothetical protein